MWILIGGGAGKVIWGLRNSFSWESRKQCGGLGRVTGIRVSGIIVRDDIILNMRKRTNSNQNLFQMTSSVGAWRLFANQENVDLYEKSMELPHWTNEDLSQLGNSI